MPLYGVAKDANAVALWLHGETGSQGITEPFRGGGGDGSKPPRVPVDPGMSKPPPPAINASVPSGIRVFNYCVMRRDLVAPAVITWLSTVPLELSLKA